MQGEGWVGTISDACTCSEAIFMGFKEELTCTKGTSHFCNFSILLKLYYIQYLFSFGFYNLKVIT